MIKKIPFINSFLLHFLLLTADGGKDGKGPGHVSLQSTQDMTADDLKNGINSLGWQKTPKN